MKTGKLFEMMTTTSFVVAFSIISTSPAFAGIHSSDARVESIKGAAHYSTDQKVWLPLKNHAHLKPGTLIKTAEESTVQLVFKESGSAITANPNTIVRIAKASSTETGLEVISDTNLELLEGSLKGTQSKNSASSHFKISLNEGFAILEPSDYSLSVDRTLTILRGSAPLRYDNILLIVSPQQVASLSQDASTLVRPLAAAKEKPVSQHGNNGVGNGEDPAPPGNPKPNDGPGTSPGNPGNGRPLRP